MKPILIFCGAPKEETDLPDWLHGGRTPRFFAPEDFLQSGLEKMGPDTVLLLVGPRVLHGVRLLRRYPKTALSCIAVSGKVLVPGADVLADQREAIEEKMHRIHDALAAFTPLDQPDDLGDSAIVHFLRFLTSRGLQGIEAQPDIASPYGYSYPLCGIFFNDALEAWPNDLVKMGFFSRRFHDTIHVCPHCDRYNLNYREVCPDCASPNIGLGEVLHHFRCGEVAPESVFLKGEEFVCPKCEQKLRHLGVDYDRPTEFYHCRACPAVFSEPPNDVICLSCGKTGKLAGLREHIVHNYYLNEEAKRAAREGVLLSSSVEAMFDQELGGLYSTEFFQEFSKIEMRRRKRYGVPVTVLGLVIDFPDGKNVPVRKLRQLVGNVARIMRENLRNSDLIARFGERLYLSLLTDTPNQNSAVVVGRLEQAANQTVEKFGVRFRIREITESYFRWLEQGNTDGRTLESLVLSSEQSAPPPPPENTQGEEP